MELRPYQIEVINKIQTSWNTNQNVMLQMPTGTGKTNVFCEIIRLHRNQYPGKRIIVLTHKRELVKQTVTRLKSFGIVPGVILAGTIQSPEHQVQVATVQSLIRRMEWANILTNISLIIVDEAHHSPSETYRKLIVSYQSEHTHLLGVTATPRRSDGQGFRDIFQVLIQSWQIKKFIDLGFLADVEHHKTATYDDIKKKLPGIPIDAKTNDYDENKLSELMSGDSSMADAVDSYIRYRGDFKKSIVFAVNVLHSKALTKRFLEQNISAAHIDGNTDQKLRENILADFKSGAISVLCNVGIITEGFDCPDAQIIQLVRPTKSITLYLQQVGRVMRPKPNGSHALILDSASCYDEFGSVKANRRWTLEPDSRNGFVERTDDSDCAFEPELPLEKNKPMVKVDQPSRCPLNEYWFNELPNEYRLYFLNRFSHLCNKETLELVNTIWATEEWDLSGLPFNSISALRKLTNIKSLNIRSTNCTSLRPIMSLKRLESLYCSNTPIEELRLPNENKEVLKRLNISRTEIKDISIICEYPMLEKLNINHLHLNMSSYDSISRLYNLRTFSAIGTNFSSLSSLHNSKDSIETLVLSNSDLSSIGTIHHFQALKHLDISDTKVTSLDKLWQCRSLETVAMKGVKISEEERRALGNRQPVVWIED